MSWTSACPEFCWFPGQLQIELFPLIWMQQMRWRKQTKNLFHQLLGTSDCLLVGNSVSLHLHVLCEVLNCYKDIWVPRATLMQWAQDIDHHQLEGVVNFDSLQESSILLWCSLPCSTAMTTADPLLDIVIHAWPIKLFPNIGNCFVNYRWSSNMPECSCSMISDLNDCGTTNCNHYQLPQTSSYTSF